MDHIFISYKHQDGDFALILKQSLEQAGFTTWLDDEIRAGEEWREEIDKAIRAANALVVIMTPEARSSEQVTYEWSFALGIGIKVIPIMLRQTELHQRLESLQYIDFTNRHARPWQKLIDRLKQIKHATKTLEAKSDVPIAPDAQDAIPKLLKKLHDHDTRTRLGAAKVLGQMRNSESTSSLLEILGDNDYEVRIAVVEALGEIGDPSSVIDLLVVAAGDREHLVREAAYEALAKIGGERAIRGVVSGLRDSEFQCVLRP